MEPRSLARNPVNQVFVDQFTREIETLNQELTARKEMLETVLTLETSYLDELDKRMAQYAADDWRR